MIELEKISRDENGIWHLDEYFFYIGTVADSLPAELRLFAEDVENYQLRGRKSLHDSKMLAFSLTKELIDGAQSNAVRISVVFLDQMHEGRFSLEYGDVSAYMVVEADAPCREAGATDVLLHEVEVLNNGKFKHTVLFSGGGGYVVEFERFSRLWMT